MIETSRVVYRPRESATPEAELSALAAIYTFVLFNSQSTRGGPHDLTNKTTTEHVENGPRTTEKEKTQRG
jgi:hypothetical protein